MSEGIASGIREKIKEHLAKEDILAQGVKLCNVELREILSSMELRSPKRPVMRAMKGFQEEEVSFVACPTCGNPVTNYYNPKVKPSYCMMCGQALDHTEKEPSKKYIKRII